MTATDFWLALCLWTSPHYAIPTDRGIFSGALRRFWNRWSGDLLANFTRAIAAHLAESIRRIEQELPCGASQ